MMVSSKIYRSTDRDLPWVLGVEPLMWTRFNKRIIDDIQDYLPGVGSLQLVSFRGNELLEDTVFVSQTVT